MKNKVLDLVYNTHTDGEEKIMFMKDYIAKHDEGDLIEDISGMLKFFYKHIPLHFAYEEVVISALLNKGALSNDETANMHKILEEHKALLKSFMKIKEMSGKINSAGKKQKDGLIAVINETCYSLIKHAEFEDIHLFPLAGRIVDEELLSAIEKQMSRIVY